MSAGPIDLTDVKATNQKLPKIKQVQSDPRVVLKAFNTWAFKRQQPTEQDRLLQFVESAAGWQLPVSFVLYWGKGLRSAIAEPEIECLQYLRQMAQRIQDVYPPGARFTLITTDTHAEHNGHSTANIASYFGEVAAAASRHGFSCVSLKAIVHRERTRIVDFASDPSAEMISKLEPCAAKWYRGDNTIANGAEQYYRLNMLEKRAVELAYPSSIFITYNSSEYRELFPDQLPVFYMFSMRKGTSVKPWFVDVENSNGRNDDRGFAEFLSEVA